MKREKLSEIRKELAELKKIAKHASTLDPGIIVPDYIEDKPDGRVKNGGLRVGAGRKKMRGEYEIKYKLQSYLPKAYYVIKKGLEKGEVSSAWKLIDKFVADKKNLEVTGADGGAIQYKYTIDMAGGYIPPVEVIDATPEDDNAGSAQVQNYSVAPKSEEDNNSHNGNYQASPV